MLGICASCQEIYFAIRFSSTEDDTNKPVKYAANQILENTNKLVKDAAYKILMSAKSDRKRKLSRFGERQKVKYRFWYF